MLESDVQGPPMGLAFHVVNNEKKRKKKGKKRGRGFMMKWAAASLPLKENIEMSRSPKPLCLRY